MSHVYHDDLPGFDARQIWHDGCPECERRGRSLPGSMRRLDLATFNRACERADVYWRDGAGSATGRISEAEEPLLRTLAIVRGMLAGVPQ